MTEGPIRIGAKAGENVVCASCSKSLPGAEAHSFRGKKGEDVFFCPECKQKIDAELAAETADPNLFGAIVLGALAGLAAGAVWFLVEALTGYRVGYIALGAGYLVGLAVVWGSGKKRGSALQLVSVAITLLAVCGASYFSAIYNVNKYLAGEAAGEGEKLASYIWISPFHPELLKMVVSPMGVLIWGIALYIAFRVPQARKL